MFQSIAHHTEGFLKEKGSKFYAYAYPVSNAQEVTDNLTALRKRYHDASHHCYAWVLGLDTQTSRANDDGEPSHSAGDPILGQIKSYGLTNVLVVVVRYFGGTKLGVGGLIASYREAAKLALDTAQIEELVAYSPLVLKFPYELLNTIERMVNDFEIQVADRNYQEFCEMEGKIPTKLKDQFRMIANNRYKLHYSFTDENR